MTNKVSLICRQRRVWFPFFSSLGWFFQVRGWSGFWFRKSVDNFRSWKDLNSRGTSGEESSQVRACGGSNQKLMLNSLMGLSTALADWLAGCWDYWPTESPCNKITTWKNTWGAGGIIILIGSSLKTRVLHVPVPLETQTIKTHKTPHLSPTNNQTTNSTLSHRTLRRAISNPENETPGNPVPTQPSPNRRRRQRLTGFMDLAGNVGFGFGRVRVLGLLLDRRRRRRRQPLNWRLLKKRKCEGGGGCFHFMSCCVFCILSPCFVSLLPVDFLLVTISEWRDNGFSFIWYSWVEPSESRAGEWGKSEQ